MKIPAIIDFASGIIFSVLFLLQILYFIFNFKKRCKTSAMSIDPGATIVAIEPFLAFYAFFKSSGLANRFEIEDIAIALFAVIATFWTIYAYIRLSKNIEE